MSTTSTTTTKIPTSTTGAQTIFGGGMLGWYMTTPSTAAPILSILKDHDVTQIDTAQIYQASETVLGELEAHKDFTIDTKQAGGKGLRTLKRDVILRATGESLGRLRMSKVHTLYIHAPDHEHPLEDTLAGFDALYQQGCFERFGLSNYGADDVQRIHELCTEKGYVKPTVYQGNYNPLARRAETEFFPVLRKLGIQFNAYSATAGGFLTKTAQQVNDSDNAGRFNKDSPVAFAYRDAYAKPAMLSQLAVWSEIARDAGCSPADLANRWVKYHSGLKRDMGDGIIIGARTADQLQGTLRGLEEGLLSESICKRIDALWDVVKEEAPVVEFLRQ